VKGVTKDVTVPVSFTYLADKLGARLGDPKLHGDLLVLRANFTINRSDYGIKAGEFTDKVAETIHLSLSIAGSAQKS
jgi:polyisoprenoid-binding protein YceI